MAKCVLFGATFSIPNSYIRDHIVNNRTGEAADAAEEEFNTWYKKCSGINDVMKGYYRIASEIMEKYVFKPLFKHLADLNIYDVSEDMYRRRVMDFEHISGAYGDVESDLEDIDENKDDMKQYRAARKANRGRFTGGGFGMAGAIKGSMEAGALNAASGMVHGSVNAIGNIGSAVGASMKKAALYNEDTRETLSTGIYNDICKAYRKHKELVNDHIEGYYENGFDPMKAFALFENAQKIPAKRKELLLQAIEYSPEEKILSYIFINYPTEKENAFRIAQLFEIDLSGYVEESFAKSYTEDAQNDPNKAEAIKANIINEMKKYGIKTSATLTKINNDMLVWLAKRYQISLVDGINEPLFKRFREYDAPNEQKKEVAYEYGMWELAMEYGFQYSTEVAEKILGRYYSEKAKNDENTALEVKKKLQEIMKALSISDSATFNQLEKDCIKRLCRNIAVADEEQCNQLKQKLTEYSALQKNKQEFFDAIQARIEAIWSKEDGEIFDNVYMETNIYDQNQIQESIKFIEQKGRTSSAQKYITALKACTPENIKLAKKYQDENAKTLNTVGIVLTIVGVVLGLAAFPFAVLAVAGIILIVSYCRKKKMWKTLTIDGTQIHPMLLVDSEESIPNSTDVTENTSENNVSSDTTANNIEKTNLEENHRTEERKKLSASDDKGIGNTIYKIIFWCLSICYWFLAFVLVIGSSMLLTAICFVLTGALINPMIRISLIKKKGLTIPKWASPIIAIVGFFVGILLP